MQTAKGREGEICVDKAEIETVLGKGADLFLHFMDILKTETGKAKYSAYTEE